MMRSALRDINYFGAFRVSCGPSNYDRHIKIHGVLCPDLF